VKLLCICCGGTERLQSPLYSAQGFSSIFKAQSDEYGIQKYHEDMPIKTLIEMSILFFSEKESKTTIQHKDS